MSTLYPSLGLWSSDKLASMGVHDPDDMFKFVEDGLESRLPLRQLAWTDANGSARSVAEVHVAPVDVTSGASRALHDLNLMLTSSPLPSSGSSTSVGGVHDTLRVTGDSSSTPPTTPPKTIGGVKNNSTPLEAVAAAIAGRSTPGGSSAASPNTASASASASSSSPLHPSLWYQIPHLTVFVVRCEDYDEYVGKRKRVLQRAIAQLDTQLLSFSTSASAAVTVRAAELAALAAAGKATVSPVKAVAPVESTLGLDVSARPSPSSSPPPELPPADEYIILYLPLGTRSHMLSNASKTYKKVFNQMRNDFGKDRCFKLDLFDPAKKGTPVTRQWDDLIAKLKGMLTRSFTTRAAQYEHEIRHHDALRQSPQWDFVKFFLIKQSYAYQLEQMGQVADALRLYDELAALLEDVDLHALLDPDGELVGEFALPGSIFDVDSDHFREAILRRELNELQFRRYVFGCQCHLLFRLHNPIEVVTRAQEFMRTYRRLVQHERFEISTQLQDMWMVSAVMDVCRACKMHEARFQSHKKALSLEDKHRMAGGLGDLVSFVLGRLKHMGTTFGYISFTVPSRERTDQLAAAAAEAKLDIADMRQDTPPAQPEADLLFSVKPFVQVDPAASPEQQGRSTGRAVAAARRGIGRRRAGPHRAGRARPTGRPGTISMTPAQIANIYKNRISRLLLACHDPELFCRLFLQVCAAARECYDEAHRWRMTMRVMSFEAYVCFGQGNYLRAMKLFSEETARFKQEAWLNLYCSSLMMVAVCQRILRQYQGYVRSCFALIGSPALHTAPGCDPKRIQAELEAMLEQATATEDPQRLPFVAELPAVLDILAIRALVSTSEIELHVESRFSEPIRLDEFSLHLRRRRHHYVASQTDEIVDASDNVTLEFIPSSATPDSAAVQLPPGKSVMRLSNKRDLSLQHDPAGRQHHFDRVRRRDSVTSLAVSLLSPQRAAKRYIRTMPSPVREEQPVHSPPRQKELPPAALNSSASLLSVSLRPSPPRADSPRRDSQRTASTTSYTSLDTSTDEESDFGDAEPADPAEVAPEMLDDAAPVRYSYYVASVRARIHSLELHCTQPDRLVELSDLDSFNSKTISRYLPGISVIVQPPAPPSSLLLGPFQYLPVTVFTNHDSIEVANIVFGSDSGRIEFHDSRGVVGAVSPVDAENNDAWKQVSLDILDGCMQVNKLPPRSRLDFAIAIRVVGTQRKDVDLASVADLGTGGSGVTPGFFEVQSELHKLECTVSFTRSQDSALALPGADAMPGISSPLTYVKSIELSLVEPLVTFSSIERLQDRLFLQVYVGLATPMPVIIVDYSLQLPDAFSVSQDANSRVRYRALLPGDECCLVFEVSEKALASSVAEEDANGDHVAQDYSQPSSSLLGELQLTCAHYAPVEAEGCVNLFGAADASSELRTMSPAAVTELLNDSTQVQQKAVSTVSRPVLIVSHHEDFNVSLSFPPYGFIGQMIALTVTVSRIRRHHSIHDPERLVMLYELLPEHGLWMLAGKQKCQFVLAPGDCKTFSCHLLPVACGYLPIPRVNLKRHRASGGVTRSVSDIPSIGSPLHPSPVVDPPLMFVPVPEERIQKHLASQQVYIYPPGDFQTGCELALGVL